MFGLSHDPFIIIMCVELSIAVVNYTVYVLNSKTKCMSVYCKIIIHTHSITNRMNKKHYHVLSNSYVMTI